MFFSSTLWYCARQCTSKLLKNNMTRICCKFFLLTKSLDLQDYSTEMMRSRKWLFKHLNASLTTPMNHPIILPKCGSLFWYVIPLLLIGAILKPWALFQQVDHEKNPIKPGVGMTTWCYWSKCLPNASIQWLLVKPRTSSLGQCMQYCTGALPWSLTWPAK